MVMVRSCKNVHRVFGVNEMVGNIESPFLRPISLKSELLTLFLGSIFEKHELLHLSFAM